MRRTTRLATALAMTVVLLGACGSASDSASAPAATAAPAAGGSPASPATASPAAPAPGPPAADALPNTLVHNVANDQLVKLADFVTPGMPVLVWFWAPH